MLLMKMLALRRAPLSLTLTYPTRCEYISVSSRYLLTEPQYRQYCKSAHLKVTSDELVRKANRKGTMINILRKVGFNTEKYRLMATGYFTYENTVDSLNYSNFFKDFNMPDTFFSWFLITQLHVWMLMVRYMAEGDKGKLVRNNLVEAMWKDIDLRVNKLGAIHPKIKRKQLMELSYQFNSALLNYDEGILSDDKTLAGALWRTFFGLECNNPEHLERLLVYVRTQMDLLEKIPPDEILFMKQINWVDFSTIR